MLSAKLNNSAPPNEIQESFLFLVNEKKNSGDAENHLHSFNVVPHLDVLAANVHCVVICCSRLFETSVGTKVRFNCFFCFKNQCRGILRAAEASLLSLSLTISSNPTTIFNPTAASLSLSLSF